jgi:hypothetical protein
LLALKKLTARAVHDKLEAVLVFDMITSWTVTKYRRQRQFPAFPPEFSDDIAPIVIDDAILVRCESQPFASD